ncbi:MAG: hypothetical protein ASARMPREDX12_002564 [Alectoria sarmentosa]|nr:MAG: hypothetical protein ASARMPREDX12_002564 [Alectoria sarmentosa]
MNSTQDHTISRRKRKRTAKKLERAQSTRARTEADAAIRNSRAARFHQILSRPGRGGLTAKGAQQLQQFFSKKVPEAEKLSLIEMDDSAAMILMQMASEEVDAGELSCRELRQVTEEKMTANGANDEEGATEDGKAEEVKTEELMEAEEDMGSEEDREQGGVALANDL